MASVEAKEDNLQGETPRPASRMPKTWIRWSAVALALAGWYVSLLLLRVSLGAQADGLLEAVCGARDDAGLTGCDSVLTSPEAYISIGERAGALKLPVSTLGMAYFAFVGFWYLFVGATTRDRRAWHLLIAVVVVWGAWESLGYIRSMAFELHRWCGGCLLAHAINGCLLVLTILAWPGRETPSDRAAHPSARLALAAGFGGVAVGLLHLALVITAVVQVELNRRDTQYGHVLNDPEFIIWDYQRQSAVDIPLFEDEAFAGRAAATNTIVLFSDFQCPHCRHAHEVVAKVLEKYPEQVRAVYRLYPQDPDCNPNPRFHAGGHPSACRAASTAEAARRLAGIDAFLRMQQLLYARQDQLPHVPFARQNAAQRSLFENWAAEIGLDRDAFRQTLEDPATGERIRACIAQADRLGISAMPVVYLNGRPLRNWSKLEVWDALLAPPVTATGGPTSRPADGT